MDMIRNASNTYRLATSNIYKMPNIAMHMFKILLINIRATGLNMKYDMKIDFAKRLCH